MIKNRRICSGKRLRPIGPPLRADALGIASILISPFSSPRKDEPRKSLLTKVSRGRIPKSRLNFAASSSASKRLREERKAAATLDRTGALIEIASRHLQAIWRGEKQRAEFSISTI